MKTAILIIFLVLSGLLNAQNRPTPTGVPYYDFYRNYSTDLGVHYLYGTFNAETNSGTKTLQVLDEDGYIAWWTALNRTGFDFKYHPDLNQYLFTRRRQGTIWHYQLDDNFNFVDSTSVVNNIEGDVHEFQIFPNGNRCILGVKEYTMDLSGYMFDGTPGSSSTNVVGAVIQEFDPSDNLVFEWESVNHITPDHFIDTLFNYNANNFDYVHANSIALDDDNNLLISLRTSNLVCKIDHQTGDVIWKLGGNYSDFTFTNDGGFLAQHDARRLPNGNISIFDNQFSEDNGRGVEYALDTVAWTATLVHESNYTFPFAANSLGSYRQLSNGYEVLGWGNTRRPAPSVTLFDNQENIAADVFLRDTFVTYRAFVQELPTLPTRPTIDCATNGSSITLSVANNYTYYLWSTDENSTSITVTQPGTYQCWVNQGIGMLGSYPIIITDVNQCPNVGLNEITTDKPAVVQYFDLMGRVLEHPKPHSVYLVLLEDGTLERRYFTKD